MISETPQTLSDPYGYLNYGAGNGTYFGYDREITRVLWPEHCRMAAGWRLKAGTRFVGFHAKTLDIPLIDDIWSRIETSMGLTERTTIHRTTLANAILFEIPAFWVANDTANGMLTLFMRAVCVYGQRDQDLGTMFKAYDRTRRILRTVMWWVDGHIQTTYPALTVRDRDDYVGICAEYDGVNDEKLAAKLIKPTLPTPAAPVAPALPLS